MMTSHHQPPAVALNELLAVVKTARALLGAIDETLDRVPPFVTERDRLRAALAELDKQP